MGIRTIGRPWARLGCGLLMLAGLLAAPVTPLHAQEAPPPQPAAAPLLAYSSFLGGASSDGADGVAVGPGGDLFVLGSTFSETLLGRAVTLHGYSDLFVARFNAAGSQLIYLTVLGSQDYDNARALAVDAQGNAYVTASVYGDDTFPTHNALWPHQPANTDAVLVKFNPQGGVVYSTYLPLDTFDTTQNVAADAAGNAYVTGTFEYVMEGDLALRNQIALLKISPDGRTLLMQKQIGRRNDDSGRALALDKSGAIYLAGVTEGYSSEPGATDFPVTANAHQAQCGDILYQSSVNCHMDAVVVVLNAAGAVTYASYHGGSSYDEPTAIAADGKGVVWLTGYTSSTQFPLVNPLQSSCPVDTALDMCYSRSGFVSALRIQTPKAALIYSTFLGSTERESWNEPTSGVLDATGAFYITGFTDGSHFPVLNAIQPELTFGICSGAAAGGAQAAQPGAARLCHEGFLLKFAPSGALAFGTYLGGSSDDYLQGIATGGAGSVIVAGRSDSLDYPVTPGAFQPGPLLQRNGVLTRIETGAGPQAVTIGVDPTALGGTVQVAVVSQPPAVDLLTEDTLSGLEATVTATVDESAAVDAVYPVGTVLRLTAVPAPAYRFAGWSGDLSGAANPVLVTVRGPMAIAARFSKTPHAVYLPALREP